MYRVDPKQAVLDHVSKQTAAGDSGRSLSIEAEAIIAAPVERNISGAVVSGVAQVAYCEVSDSGPLVEEKSAVFQKLQTALVVTAVGRFPRS